MFSKVSSDYMRRQSICVFAATEESAANDLARSLIAGADAIDRLARIERRVRELAEELESDSSHEKGPFVGKVWMATRLRGILNTEEGLSNE